MNSRRLGHAPVLLTIAALAGCSSMPTIHHPKFKPVKEVYSGADLPKRPYRTLGLVRTKVNYPSLDAQTEESALCKNYYNKAAADLLHLAKRQHGDAVIDMRSVTFLVDGRSETYVTPECSDDGQEGQILAQGIAVRWKRPGEPDDPPKKLTGVPAPAGPAAAASSSAAAASPSTAQSSAAVPTAPAPDTMASPPTSAMVPGAVFAVPPAPDGAPSPAEASANATSGLSPDGSTPESAPLPVVHGSLSTPEAVPAPAPASVSAPGSVSESEFVPVAAPPRAQSSASGAHVRKIPRRAPTPPDEQTFDREMMQSEGGVPRPTGGPILRN